jgi:hypothetical protein
MLTEFLYFCTESYEPADILAAEIKICCELQMEFAIPTTLDFLYCSLQRLRWPKMFSVHRGQPDKVEPM